MKISPASALILIYLFSNLFLGAYYGFSGTLGGDFLGKRIDNINDYFLIYASEILVMVIFIIFLRFAYLLTKTKTVLDIQKSSLNRIVFFIQLSFLIYSYNTGVGQLSEDFYNTTVNNPLKYIFTFFNPDYLFLASLCISKKNSKLNIALYLFSNLYRGWIAGALVNVLFIVIAKKYHNSGIKIKYVPLIFAFFLVISPSIYYVKYVSRGAENIENSQLSDYYSDSLYEKILNASLSRFQHISETYSIVNNIETIRSGFETKNFVPFYFEIPAKNILANALNYNDNITITQYSAEKILNKSPGNIHVGIITWLLIDPIISILYIFFLLISFFTLSYLLKSLSDTNAWPFCVWISITLALHGWYSSYYIFIWSLFTIYILKKIELILKRDMKKQ
ncbi:oligosaccharide repeat unit polymerase [Providencia rettgeri]